MNEHDTLAKRLGMILTRLNAGERLSLSDLSREFGVSERTLQRDFNVRLNYLPLEREGATYFVDPKFLGKRTGLDIKALLRQMGLQRLFPSFNELLLNQLANQKHPPFLFRDIKVEDADGYQRLFRELTKAVVEHKQVSFHYKQSEYSELKPYRLVNDRGSWYLAAMHKRTLKSFRLSLLQNLQLSSERFEPVEAINEKIERNGMHWLTSNEMEVILKVDAAIAPHFRESDVLPQQQLVKVLEDGSLLLGATVTHPQQILPILRYWLPDIEVLSPLDLKQQLLYELEYSIDQLRQR